jgi:hypothetical protein
MVVRKPPDDLVTFWPPPAPPDPDDPVKSEEFASRDGECYLYEVVRETMDRRRGAQAHGGPQLVPLRLRLQEAEAYSTAALRHLANFDRTCHPRAPCHGHDFSCANQLCA